MTDDLINLLPDELRQNDQDELNAAIKKSTPVSYSRGSELKDVEEVVKKYESNPSPAITESTNNLPVNNNDSLKPSPMGQALNSSFSTKPNPDQTAKVNSLAADQLVGSKAKPLVNMTEPQRASKSGLAFLLKLFSIKPKSSTLDNAATRTNGNLSFDVNLVPQSAYNLPGKILGLRLVLAAMLVIFFISVIHWLFVFLNQSAIQKVIALQTVLDKNQAALQNYKDLAQQLNQLEVQSRSIDGLISRHIYWTQFLTKLESLTLPTIYYSGMTANPNGAVNLQVVAPSYTDAAQQLLFWQNRPEIKKIDFSGMSGNPASGEINLSIKLELDSAIFYKN
jgi:hypothetical protein